MAYARSVLRRTLFLILLAMLLCAGLGYFWLARQEKTDAYIVYTAVFEVDRAVADAFSLGDRLIDARGKEDAGEILKIARENALREDAGGVYSHPERVTLALTLGGEGKRTGGGARLGTLTPRVGDAVYLLGRARLEGLCVRVGVV